jgi:hypothetical protein
MNGFFLMNSLPIILCSIALAVIIFVVRAVRRKKASSFAKKEEARLCAIDCECHVCMREKVKLWKEAAKAPLLPRPGKLKVELERESQETPNTSWPESYRRDRSLTVITNTPLQKKDLQAKKKRDYNRFDFLLEEEHADRGHRS